MKLFACIAAVAVGCLGVDAHAADVRMAFGEKIPPFSFPATNSGIEIETYREALALKGHRLVPMYFPFVRVPLAFKAGRVDAAMTDLGEDLRAEGGHYGDSAVLYDNVLFTLKERGLSLQSPADLLPLRVVSFQGAAKRYPEWLGPLEKVGGLSEVNDQATQVRLLMVGRVDVVLSDRLIFQYFTQEVRKQGIKILPVTAHRFTVARPEDYRPVFRDAQIRDDFNAGLKQLRASGRLAQIYKQYIED